MDTERLDLGVFGLSKSPRYTASSTVTAPGWKTPPAPAAALPVITYDNGISFHFNGEEIKVIHVPTGHTDGDSENGGAKLDHRAANRSCFWAE